VGPTTSLDSMAKENLFSPVGNRTPLVAVSIHVIMLKAILAQLSY